MGEVHNGTRKRRFRKLQILHIFLMKSNPRLSAVFLLYFVLVLVVYFWCVQDVSASIMWHWRLKIPNHWPLNLFTPFLTMAGRHLIGFLEDYNNVLDVGWHPALARCAQIFFVAVYNFFSSKFQETHKSNLFEPRSFVFLQNRLPKIYFSPKLSFMMPKIIRYSWYCKQKIGCCQSFFHLVGAEQCWIEAY